MRTNRLLGVAVAFLAFAGPARAQSDECLVEVHDANGAIPDNGTICQTATGKSCAFSLQLCLDQPEDGCTPASFTPKKFRATGHCGPVGRLQVHSAGADAVCGDPTNVTVRTRLNGKRRGQCQIRTSVRSAKTGARIDVDKVTLECRPPSESCPTTTTLTTTTTTSTTTL
jgi:hypothetical protein